MLCGGEADRRQRHNLPPSMGKADRLSIHVSRLDQEMHNSARDLYLKQTKVQRVYDCVEMQRKTLALSRFK